MPTLLVTLFGSVVASAALIMLNHGGAYVAFVPVVMVGVFLEAGFVPEKFEWYLNSQAGSPLGRRAPDLPLWDRWRTDAPRQNLVEQQLHYYCGVRQLHLSVLRDGAAIHGRESQRLLGRQRRLRLRLYLRGASGRALSSPDVDGA